MTLPELGFRISVTVTIAGIAAPTVYQVGWRELLLPYWVMRQSTRVDQVRLDGAATAIRRYWASVPKMSRLAEELTGPYGASRPVFAVPQDKRIEGMRHLLSPALFISESALDQHDIALALVIFAEYQHTPAGGGLGEYDAQQEFIEIRRMLPYWLRTDYINNLAHEGTENEY